MSRLRLLCIAIDKITRLRCINISKQDSKGLCDKHYLEQHVKFCRKDNEVHVPSRNVYYSNRRGWNSDTES